jgi:alpha-ketoglutarate-dependent taurine dioxygenase
MIEIDKSYFSNISKFVNEKSYSEVKLNYTRKNICIKDITDEKINSYVMPELEEHGFTVVKIEDYLDSEPTDIGLLLERLFGESPLDKNPGKSLYAKVQAEENAKYYINSNVAQPMHTDQGYTTEYTRYVALYCFKQAQSGGDSILVSFKPLYTQLIKHFGDMIDMLFLKDSITVHNVNGNEQKPILLRLENGDVGISYSPILQKMWCTNEVFKMFDFITSYVHDLNNQRRFKLEDGQVLLIDNCLALHGRTAFPKNDGRLLFRYWFGNRFV